MIGANIVSSLSVLISLQARASVIGAAGANIVSSLSVLISLQARVSVIGAAGANTVSSFRFALRANWRCWRVRLAR